MSRYPLRLLRYSPAELREHLEEEIVRNPFLRRWPRLRSREYTLLARPEELGLGFGRGDAEVWLAVVEIGHSDAVVTLMAAEDGTIRLYFDERAGILHPDERPEVVEAGRRLLAAAAASAGACTPVASTPRPAVGRVTFYLRTKAGKLGAEAAASDLLAAGHPLSDAYREALSVLAAVRDGPA